MTRVLHAQHRGAATDTAVINGITAGGLMTANINAGFDDVVTGPADGWSMPETDRLSQFVRGSIDCQDWIEVLNILGGTTGTYVFYEAESGAATFTKHTITNPVIHTASVSLSHRGRASASWAFECKAANATSTISSMWARATAQTAAAAITYSPGLEITAATHGSSISHILGCTFNITGNLVTASTDGATGYTAVDVVWGGAPITGSLTFQDSSAMVSELVSAEADLVLTVKQTQGASNKTLTLKNCLFTGMSSANSSGPGYRGYSLDFLLNGDMIGGTAYGYNTDKPLSGDTAIITIA